MPPCSAKKFLQTDPLPFRWQSLTMGTTYFPTNYGGCVNVVVRREGVSLRVSLPFRLFHSPILLPWSNMDSCSTHTVLRFWKKTKVTLKDRADPIYFSGKCADEIVRIWQLHADRSGLGDPSSFAPSSGPPARD